MNIAIDIDRTIYDSNKCFRDVFNKASAKYSVHDSRRLGMADGLLLDKHTWLNKQYLNDRAIKALKFLHSNDKLYLLMPPTATKWDGCELMEDTSLPIEDVLCTADYTSACYNGSMDYIISANMSTLSNHVRHLDHAPGYKTKFILVASDTSSYTTGLIDILKVEDTIFIMNDWSELISIIHPELT